MTETTRTCLWSPRKENLICPETWTTNLRSAGDKAGVVDIGFVFVVTAAGVEVGGGASEETFVFGPCVVPAPDT